MGIRAVLRGRTPDGLRDQRGVTLTELTVTLGVVAILFGLAVPTIQFQIARQELQASARELTEVFRGARDAAINEGVPRYVLLVPGSPGSYQVYRFDGSAWVPDENLVSLEASFSSADVTLPSVADAPTTGVSVPEDAAYFDTRGRYPFGYSGSYQVTLHGSFGRQVTLTLYPQTGQVAGV